MLTRKFFFIKNMLTPKFFTQKTLLTPKFKNYFCVPSLSKKICIFARYVINKNPIILTLKKLTL